MSQTQAYHSHDHVEWDYALDDVLDDIEQTMIADNTYAHNYNAYNNTYAHNYNYNNYSVFPTASVNTNASCYSSANTSSSGISPVPSVASHTVNPMSFNITRFKPECGKSELKDYIFISKDCTYRLAQYVAQENWGKDGVLLYKYLDYIFRCQLFDEQVIQVHDKSKGGEFLVFHTGLTRRFDNEYLYVLLFPNFISKSHKNRQKWRVQFGNVAESFLTKNELLHKFNNDGCAMYSPYGYPYNDTYEACLPQRTVFAKHISETMYNPMCDIQVSWEERLLTNQDRISKVIGDRAFFDKSRKHLKLSELIAAFDAALAQTKRVCLMNPQLAVAQGFVDTKRKKYRMELLLPLAVHFEGAFYSFALAIAASSPSSYYSVKSVLTLNMGYNNARLVGYVNSMWLKLGY